MIPIPPPPPRRILPRLLWALVVLGLIGGAVFLFIEKTAASIEALPELKEGDIVFNTSTSDQSLAVGVASRSLLTHMGFIRFDAKGSPFVIEAVEPVGQVPLADWMVGGAGGRLKILRSNRMTIARAQQAAAFAETHFGKPYDPYFLPKDDAFYCSELVHDAFLHAGIKVGKFQKLAELNIDNNAARKLMKSRWENHPLCRSGQAKDFESCEAIMKRQEVVTPQAIADDEQMMLVYSNY